MANDFPPILRRKNHQTPSVFTPDALLREARRQKGIVSAAIPDICLLDPDGDMVRHLRATGRAHLHQGWPCYHTDLYGFEQDGIRYGIIGCAVGAVFAVLLAEELFASGCKLLLSMTSAGRILPIQPPPYFVIISPRTDGTLFQPFSSATMMVPMARCSHGGFEQWAFAIAPSRPDHHGRMDMSNAQ